MGRRTLRRVQRIRKQDHVQKQSTVAPPASHPLMDLQRSVGSQAIQRLIRSPYIQTKLQVSSPEDKDEREADQSAEAVMRSAQGGPASPSTSNTHTQPGSPHKDGSMTRAASLDSQLEGGGSSSPLPNEVREYMEPRLGADLSGVRVHTGDEAAHLSDQFEAEAFTHGHDVYFGAGKSPGKDALTAHELAHVVQQTGGGRGPAGAGVSRAQHLISRTPDAAKKKRDAKAASLSKELQTLIDGAIWKEIRKRVYPKESAAGITRAKERKAGKRADLTGLGKISALENFATAMKKVEKDWSKLSPDDRVKGIGDATNAQLTAAGVPPFRAVAKVKTDAKGYFQGGLWKFSINQELVTAGSLSKADAAELANTALHEARHAEQHFLAARYSAGPPDNKSQAAIALEQNIPMEIAKEAVKAKFDAKTDAAVAVLGKNMYKAMVTEGAVNQKISDDDYTKEMKDASDAAIKSLAALKASATDATIADATAKRDTLKAAIAEVERRYTLYRNIPYEADAHEVGDAAEQAFKGWP